MSRPVELLFCFDFPPLGGGIARWMGELALRWPAGELVVSTGSLPGGAEADRRFPNLVDRLALPARRLRTFPGLVRWSRRATRLAREHGATFAWCGNLRPAAYPAWWLRRRCGVPYGVILHGGDLLTLRANLARSPRKRATARRLLGDAAVIVANSDWTANLARTTLGDLGVGESARRIEVVRLGTDPARFRPGLDAAPFRAAHRLPEGRWLFTAARLVPHKGIDTGIRVLARLAARYPDLNYLVAGEGPSRESLLDLARSEGVLDRVHLVSGLGDEALASAYALADIYLGLSRELPMDVEGFGIALVEAQASGKPVVAGRSGGVPDAVHDGETGLLVDPEDVDAAARAVAGLLDDPARAAAIGRAGRHAVEAFFNWDRVVADLRSLSARARSAPR